jgi:arylsulfatase
MKFTPEKDGKPGAVNESFNFQGGLYDLSRDPAERYNVQFDFPEVTKELMKIADEAREDLGDDLTGKTGKNRRTIGQLKQ